MVLGVPDASVTAAFGALRHGHAGLEGLAHGGITADDGQVEHGQGSVLQTGHDRWNEWGGGSIP